MNTITVERSIIPKNDYTRGIAPWKVTTQYACHCVYEEFENFKSSIAYTVDELNRWMRDDEIKKMFKNTYNLLLSMKKKWIPNDKFNEEMVKHSHDKNRKDEEVEVIIKDI